MFKVFGFKFLAGSILKLVSDLMSYVGPVILQYKYKQLNNEIFQLNNKKIIFFFIFKV